MEINQKELQAAKFTQHELDGVDVLPHANNLNYTELQQKNCMKTSRHVHKYLKGKEMYTRGTHHHATC